MTMVSMEPSDIITERQTLRADSLGSLSHVNGTRRTVSKCNIFILYFFCIFFFSCKETDDRETIAGVEPTGYVSAVLFRDERWCDSPEM